MRIELIQSQLGIKHGTPVIGGKPVGDLFGLKAIGVINWFLQKNVLSYGLERFFMVVATRYMNAAN
ncbi:hypothetical protein GCM10027341_06240 [Spirosoma knui]